MTPCEKLGYKVGMRFKRTSPFSAEDDPHQGLAGELVEDKLDEFPLVSFPLTVGLRACYVGWLKPIIRVRAGRAFLMPGPGKDLPEIHDFRPYPKVVCTECREPGCPGPGNCY